jgi:hypothetical protein
MERLGQAVMLMPRRCDPPLPGSLDFDEYGVQEDAVRCDPEEVGNPCRPSAKRRLRDQRRGEGAVTGLAKTAEAQVRSGDQERVVL